MDCLLDHQKDVTDPCYDALKHELNSPSGAPAAVNTPAPQVSSAAHVHCPDCGRVVSVKRASNANAEVLGMLGGALAGGLLGHQIGHGSGNAVATVGGAAGGAYAGNKIAESQTRSWKVKVHFDDGTDHVFSFDSDPKFQQGDHVLKSGDSIVADPQ